LGPSRDTGDRPPDGGDRCVRFSGGVADVRVRVGVDGGVGVFGGFVGNKDITKKKIYKNFKYSDTKDANEWTGKLAVAVAGPDESGEKVGLMEKEYGKVQN